MAAARVAATEAEATEAEATEVETVAAAMEVEALEVATGEVAMAVGAMAEVKVAAAKAEAVTVAAMVAVRRWRRRWRRRWHASHFISAASDAIPLIRLVAAVDPIIVPQRRDTLIERPPVSALFPCPNELVIQAAAGVLGGHQLASRTETCSVLLASNKCLEPCRIRQAPAHVQLRVAARAQLWYERPTKLRARHARVCLEGRRRWQWRWRWRRRWRRWRWRRRRRWR